MTSRINLAVDGGDLAIPDEGTIFVFRPIADQDLSALPKERVVIIQSFYPDHAAWLERGYKVATRAEGTASLSIICVPRSKSEARALIAEAEACTAERVVVDGLKTSGIDSLYKACRKMTSTSSAYSKAHGKLFSFVPANAFVEWHEDGPTLGPESFATISGVYSADKIDRGSLLLANALPEKLGRVVVDLGAGWGYLSSAILKNAGVEILHLVEAEEKALTCAKLNVQDARAAFHWDDARSFSLKTPVDTVVMNPPFHTSRAAEPALGQGFIQAAARLLKPSGTLLMVANRHLPYENTLSEFFRDVQEIGGDSGFKLLQSRHVKRGPRA
ncbi:class I SAM-dependent methyltransferase [Cochlodiniinecator piscidefendens]|uniref:class I SAM-dependent methyltransferase n=1 Tax=Cochlodiniinecator piscidefendens TaxID=2715756 RepID=UPI001409D4B7|nr:methyltransferase [Cochlodiniinecator piscidefendens]